MIRMLIRLASASRTPHTALNLQAHRVKRREQDCSNEAKGIEHLRAVWRAVHIPPRVSDSWLHVFSLSHEILKLDIRFHRFLRAVDGDGSFLDLGCEEKGMAWAGFGHVPGIGGAAVLTR